MRVGEQGIQGKERGEEKGTQEHSPASPVKNPKTATVCGIYIRDMNCRATVQQAVRAAVEMVIVSGGSYVADTWTIFLRQCRLATVRLHQSVCRLSNLNSRFMQIFTERRWRERRHSPGDRTESALELSELLLYEFTNFCF